ncbi:MAG: hypothetical protein OXE93_00365 [bacterium]|nr:hypothetical protein [bacterium]MCY4258320.1 hypothetical protein [bacterium]
MSTKKSTTLRVPTKLRDEIARLAELKDTTMQEVVAEAVRRFEREEWWASVYDALNEWDEPTVSGYATDAQNLEGTTLDGLDAA